MRWPFGGGGAADRGFGSLRGSNSKKAPSLPFLDYWGSRCGFKAIYYLIIRAYSWGLTGIYEVNVATYGW